jgi:hypothetical protein
MTAYPPAGGLSGVPLTVTEKKRRSDSYMPGSHNGPQSGVHKTQQKHLKQIKGQLGGAAESSVVLFPDPDAIPDQAT